MRQTSKFFLPPLEALRVRRPRRGRTLTAGRLLRWLGVLAAAVLLAFCGTGCGRAEAMTHAQLLQEMTWVRHVQGCLGIAMMGLFAITVLWMALRWLQRQEQARRQQRALRGVQVPTVPVAPPPTPVSPPLPLPLADLQRIVSALEVTVREVRSLLAVSRETLSTDDAEDSQRLAEARLHAAQRTLQDLGQRLTRPPEAPLPEMYWSAVPPPVRPAPVLPAPVLPAPVRYRWNPQRGGLEIYHDTGSEVAA